ncbi:MAG: hypothetical protein AB7P07_10945 [Hyphomonadaceae bacterium]
MKLKRATLIALVVSPIVGGAAGVMIGRANSASADDAAGCAEPTMYIDLAENVSMLSGGPDSVAACDGPTCHVAGAEQVEINADGRVQCVNVTEGQTLTLTRRSEGLSLSLNELGK